jgi:hypothetical protein
MRLKSLSPAGDKADAGFCHHTICSVARREDEDPGTAKVGDDRMDLAISTTFCEAYRLRLLSSAACPGLSEHAATAAKMFRQMPRSLKYCCAAPALCPKLLRLGAFLLCNSQVQARESNDSPILNAFCRVAPSLRFRLFAIFFAEIFLRAADFNSRTSAVVQARLFLAIAVLRFSKCALIAVNFNEGKLLY